MMREVGIQEIYLKVKLYRIKLISAAHNVKKKFDKVKGILSTNSGMICTFFFFMNRGPQFLREPCMYHQKNLLKYLEREHDDYELIMLVQNHA